LDRDRSKWIHGVLIMDEWLLLLGYQTCNDRSARIPVAIS
jgi:hypothetical protein